MNIFNNCKHRRAVADHASLKLAAVHCTCGKTWSGDPSRPHTPLWVKSAVKRRIAQIKAKVKP